MQGEYKPSDQTEKDFQELVKAAKSGRIKVADASS